MNSVSSNAVYNSLRTGHSSLRPEDFIIPSLPTAVASLASADQQGVRINRVSKNVYRLHFEPVRFTLGTAIGYFGILDVTQALAHFYGATHDLLCSTESTVLAYNDTDGNSSAAGVYMSNSVDNLNAKYVVCRYGVTGSTWEPGDTLSMTGDLDIILV